MKLFDFLAKVYENSFPVTYKKCFVKKIVFKVIEKIIFVSKIWFFRVGLRNFFFMKKIASFRYVKNFLRLKNVSLGKYKKFFGQTFHF